MQCPDPETLYALVTDKLARDERALIASHVTRCTPCCTAVEVLLVLLDPTARRTGAVRVSPPAPDARRARRRRGRTDSD